MHEPWRTDQAFAAAMAGVVSLVDPVRCFMLWQLARNARRLPGSFAELGVYRGGTALLLARVVQNACPMHLFDTFEGMPEVDATKDIHRKGDFADASLDGVQRLLTGFTVEYHVGFFPQTAQWIKERFAFAHVDADIYQSVRDACEFFWPRMTPGGVMVFDDYGFEGCPGAKCAVDEFFGVAGRPLPIYLPSGQAIVWA